MPDWTKIEAYIALLDAAEFKRIVAAPRTTTFRLHYHRPKP